VVHENPHSHHPRFGPEPPAPLAPLGISIMGTCEEFMSDFFPDRHRTATVIRVYWEGIA
jgi:hypothetical protein